MGLLMASGAAGADAKRFARANRVLHKGVLEYGDKYYDKKAHLVRRMDYAYKGRLDVAQQSLEYAAALFDANRDLDRANAVIGAVLDHQWLKDKGTHWYGNFIWWHDLKRPVDANAVAFMSPWLSYYLIEHSDKLTDAIRARLRTALPLCIEAVRKHRGPVHYDNIWFLKAASLVLIARALDRPELIEEAEGRLDQWFEYVSRQGINEFNSPCYAAVNIYALEFIWHYAPNSARSLRKKTQQLLDFLYADVFQNWHGEASIGAGTHSRAYPRDRLTGESLVSFLVYKQCGGKLRTPIRAFEYNFAVNDYRVPDRIRAVARKQGKLPLELRASHPCQGNRGDRVDRSLYLASEVSLGTQTGYRASIDQALPFKITYAGSKVDERASFIRPVPGHDGSRTRGTLQFAHHQAGPRAIVLYEADQKGRRENACLRLVIEPREEESTGGMLDEILVDGKPYNRKRRELKPGAVIAWRVGKAVVAIRLLDSWGVDAPDPARLVPKRYVLGPIKGAGLCLHGLVCYRPKKPVAVDNLSCGFVVRVGSVKELGDLAKLSEAAASWAINETRDDAKRDVIWADGDTSLRLVWDGAKNEVLRRTTDGKKLGPFPLYESSLIHLKRGGPLRVTEPRK